MQLLWIDLETTGLDPQRDAILEIAVCAADLSTPFDARELYRGVLWHPGSNLDPFIVDMHGKNGLLAECASSQLFAADVDRALSELVPEAPTKDERPVLAGSSIHFDLAFLRAGLPMFASRLSHRLYDVSAVKLFCQSLGMPKFPKAEAHRAGDDIRESIEHAKACATWLGK